MATENKKINNKFKVYCVINPETKDGHCISTKNPDANKKMKVLLLAKILGYTNFVDFQKVLNNLRKTNYKSVLGLSDFPEKDNYDLEDISLSLQDYIKNIPIDAKLQLIACILKLNSIEEVKQLAKKDYLNIIHNENIEKINKMDRLWYKYEIKGGSKKNIKPLYMVKKNKVKKGGTGQPEQSLPSTHGQEQPVPITSSTKTISNHFSGFFSSLSSVFRKSRKNAILEKICKAKPEEIKDHELLLQALTDEARVKYSNELPVTGGSRRKRKSQKLNRRKSHKHY